MHLLRWLYFRLSGGLPRADRDIYTLRPGQVREMWELRKILPSRRYGSEEVMIWDIFPTWRKDNMT